MSIAEFEADLQDAGLRADVVLSRHIPDLSRTLARALIEEGRVTVGGRIPRAAARVHAGDSFRVDVVLPPSLTAEPESIPLVIVYQDSAMVVIEKPAGLVVHPAPGHDSGTLANALAAHFPQSRAVGSEQRPGIVHRLDKDTSGLMVVALTPAAHSSLQRQISSRSAHRRYLAVAAGNIQPERGTIDAPIGRDPRDRKRMATYGTSARPARTSYRVLDYMGPRTYLEASLHTGRTHQIRVHLSALHHPIVGDSVYGGESYPGLRRHFLHAHELTLRSPGTGQVLELTSPLPPDLERALRSMRSI